ncbi:hypothetical protein EDD16DRAFT_1707178 [Pisolithus croceorrhizus]|nr:hypothetical protein EDD16DRAFT_1707178 [Pisolithus croceorrhizus]
MDYRLYFPPITLRKVFGKERSPSPSSSEVTARKVFNFESEHLIQSQLPVEKMECTNNLIPPPHGLLSKPNSGGYALQEVLAWGDDTYDSIQKGLHLVCEKHLDMNSPYHLQQSESLSAFFEAAREQFPILSRYQDSWPARDFAKMYLKNKVGSDKAKTRSKRTCND